MGESGCIMKIFSQITQEAGVRTAQEWRCGVVGGSGRVGVGRDGVTVSICPQPCQLGPPPAQKDICWEKTPRVVFRFFFQLW